MATTATKKWYISPDFGWYISPDFGWYIPPDFGWYIPPDFGWYIPGGFGWYIPGALLGRSPVQYGPAGDTAITEVCRPAASQLTDVRYPSGETAA
jgi:hypothetical protein